MFKNLFTKFFSVNDSERIKTEQALKSMTVEDVVCEIETKKNENNEQEITSQMSDEKENVVLEEKEQEVQESVEQTEEEQPVEESQEQEKVEEPVEDAPAVSEEAEVVEEQPNTEVEGNEPPETEIAETPEQEQEEPQEVVEEQEQPEVEDEQPTDKVEQVVEQTELPQDVIKEVVDEKSNESLIKEIEQLKAENAQKEIELKKMELAKEIEADYSGLPAKLEDKVNLVYEIQNSELSEDTKSFIFNSLKSLSAQNVKDCEEVGYEQEVVVDEKEMKQQEVKKAMAEHDLTENQAFLFVNGDRTLAEAKKASDKVRKRKK